MKQFHTNTKLVFAYQDKESRAAALNPSLSATATGSSVIRVVAPKKDYAESMMTHFNYSTAGTGWEVYSTDSVVGVAISGVYRTDKITGTSTNVGTAAVQSITRVQSKEINGQLFDIQLTSELENILGSNTSLYKAVIEIFFSSGDVEDLVLNLKSAGDCKLIITPDDLRAGPFFVNVEGQTDIDSTFIGYSVAKAYRSLNQRKNASQNGGTSRDLFGIGSGGYSTFSAPFGFIMDTVPSGLGVSIPSGPSYAPSGYATSSTSYLTWFTANSDMTRMRIPSAPSYSQTTIDVEENESTTNAPIVLAKLFGRAVTLHDYNSNDPDSLAGQDLSYLSRVSPEKPNLLWGQNFGWLTTINEGDITNTSTASVAVSANEMNFGVPPVFKEQFQNANAAGVNADAPSNFWGAFSDAPAATDGSFIQDFTVLGSNSDGPLDTNPAEIRYSRLFFGADNKVPGTAVNTNSIVGDLNFDLNAPESFLLQYDLDSTRNYFCFYPSYSLGDNSFNTPIRLGSIRNIGVNPGANFFYTGAAGTRTNAYIPIFKGYIRALTILRYGNLGAGGSSSALGSQIAFNAINSGSSDFSGLDILGMYLGSTGTANPDGSLGLNRFNGVDLAMSMLFAGHTYPDRPAGTLAETQSEHIPALTGSTGMMNLYTVGANMLSNTQGGDILPSSGVTGKAQDIAFLLCGVTPDPYNLLGEEPSDPEDANNVAVSRNHPIGHALSAKTLSTTSPPISSNTHWVETQFDYSSPSSKPFAFTSRAHHSDYGETVSTNMPPYPYAPTDFKDNTGKASYKNYAGPDLGTDNEGYWAVSTGGSNFTVDSGKGITVPTEAQGQDGTSFIVQTGTNDCLQIFKSAVNFVGSTGNDLKTSISNSEVSIRYTMDYLNSCTNEFDNSGSKITSGTTVAARITEVLAIFPHIEYRPLAMTNALGENPFAYTTIVEDDNDVDDIFIEQISAGIYRLTVIITADASDVIQTDLGDGDAPFADVWGDTPWPSQPSTYSNGLPQFSQRYASVEGSADYAGHKASYITVASAANWNEFGQSTKDRQSTLGNATEFAYHTPFIGFNNPIEEDDVTVDVFGCTDPNADNYDPQANVDDGSCIDCNTVSTTDGLWDLENLGLQAGQGTPSGGMRVGVYNPQQSPGGYLFGTIGGTSQYSEYFNPSDPTSIYTTPGAQYGGAVVSTNALAGQQAVVNLSIKAVGINTGISGLLSYMEAQGESYTGWRLRIKPVTDELLSTGLNFNESYSSVNPIPAVLSNTTAIYDAVATGGTLFEPTWDNISTSTTPLSGLLAGFPYILELQLDPTRFDVSCTTLNNENNVVLGLMWVSFCSCANTNNDYFFTAMNGATWPWQQSGASAFPILAYNAGNPCPDSVDISNLSGDSPYPQNICFAQDDALSSCEDYWLYCIANTFQECSTTIDSIDEAYQEGGNYFFDYINGSITTAIEGVYNSNVDGFVWNPDIEYTIVVSNDSSTYFSVQNQTDNIASPSDNIFQNEFVGIVDPGVYTVEFTFNGPYADGFSDTQPCVFVETVTILPPSEICENVIPGCTDETADNYDPTATIDDGSCDSSDPCNDTLLNPALSLGLNASPSDSLCIEDTVTVGGIDYTSTVIVPVNNGSVTSTITYTAGASGTGLNNFAILVLQENSLTAGIDTIVDSVGVMFTNGNIPSNSIDGVTIDGIGYWSPLFTVGDANATFTYTLNNLAPGSYYIIAVANPSTVGLANCGDQAFINILEQLSSIVVGLNDPAEPCPEPCIGIECEDYVLGCTDPEAENYNPDATYDDGNCEYVTTFCEQNPNNELCIDCTDLIDGPAPRFASGNLDETICDPVTGSDGYCTDPNACNYNPDAPLDLSNNLICDYCSCVGPDDPDCYEDTDCDPADDPNCQEQEPECPDPNNPDCDPTIYDPCPTGDCGPPIDPCIILGNCPEDGTGGGDDDDPFTDVVNPVDVTCVVDVETADGSQLNFSAVQQQAFLCMSQEGQKLLFRMKSGAYYDDTDVLKLSLIAYLFAGGLNKTELPCLFNCNYDSADKARAYSCTEQWAAAGARFYNSTDSYSRGDIIVYYYLKGKKVTRNFYTATRDIQPIDLHPRYFGSGWHRCQDINLRTADKNNIATGEEEYLQVFWEFMTRFCNECEIGSISEQLEDINNVDPTVLKNYLDPKTNRPNNYSNGSGIIGEDGDEIIF